MFVLVDSDRKDGQQVCVCFWGKMIRSGFCALIWEEMLNGSLMVIMGSGRMFGDGGER